METLFVIDGIKYVHPHALLREPSVFVRSMISILNGEQRLCPMFVDGNTPKQGLMDSEIDEEFVNNYWMARCL